MVWRAVAGGSAVMCSVVRAEHILTLLPRAAGLCLGLRASEAHHAHGSHFITKAYSNQTAGGSQTC